MSRIPTYKQLVKNLTIFGGSQVFTVIAAIVRNKCAAEIIGPLAVGLNSLYLTVVNFVSSLSGMGVNVSAVRSVSECYERGGEELEQEIYKVRKTGMLLGSLGALIVLLLSPVFSWLYFGDTSHTWQFLTLSVVVFLIVVSGIETAIMKATRHVKSIATTMIASAFVSVVTIVPLYLWLGAEGVIWAFVSSSVVSCSIIIAVGYRQNRQKSFGMGWKELIKTMSPVIMLGMAYVASGVVDSGLELGMQTYFEYVAGLSFLGLFRSGYQMGVTYTGMIFTAVGNDYFPRLSAICNDEVERNILVRKQIKVLLAVTTPLVIMFIIFVPWIVPLLYSHAFDPIMTMVRWSSLSIIAKSVSLPMNYIPLVMGKSKHYLLLESFSCVTKTVMIVAGYHLGGFDGIGIGILASHIIDIVVLLLFCKKKYNFSIWGGEQ